MTAAFAVACLLGAGGATQALAASPSDPVLPIYVDPVNGSDENDGTSWDKAMKTITNAVAKSETAAYMNERRVQVTLAKGTYVMDGMVPVYLKTTTSIVGDPKCDRSEIVLTLSEGATTTAGMLGFGSREHDSYDNVIANLTISNVTTSGGAQIQGGQHGHSGRWSQVVSNVVFTQCRRISGNNNPGSAGMTTSGRTLVVDCLFSGLTNSYGAGAAAYCFGGGWFRNCRIENCAAASGASSMIISYPSWGALDEHFIVDGCTFTNNYSPNGGGCVRDIPIVRDCTFVDNFSGSQGIAGFWSNQSYFSANPPQVVNCTFIGNRGNGQYTPGGVLSFWCGGVVSNCTFTGNVSTGACAGVAHPLELVDCTFTSNVCTYASGNVAAVGGALFYSSISGSEASYPAGRTPLVSGCRFVGNSSGNGSRGGAMRAMLPVEVEDSVFEGNDAGFGGAIAWDAASGSIRDCTFSGNVAYGSSGGAAIYASIASGTADDALTVRNCLFEGNALTNAAVQGSGSAAVLLSSGPRILLESCTVVSNSAAKGATTAPIHCADASGSGIGQLYVTNTVVALNVGAGGGYAPAISSASGFTQELAARVGYSYLHPATATSADWWADAQHVTDSDDAPRFKSGTWIPSAGSALRDAGLFQAWMDGAFDLQRNADGEAFVQRVYNGVPDVGAFERVPSGGFTVIVR